jgi:hypothetical protein
VPWVRIDDGLASHPKVLAAWTQNPASIGLWTLGAAWSARHRTDGHVAAAFVSSLIPGKAKRERAVAPLVDAGLWMPNGTGWLIHDWSDYNGTRAELSAARKVARRTGRAS